MKNSSKFICMFLRNETYGGDLKVTKGGGGGVENGPATRPRATSLDKFSCTISGCARAVGRFLEKRANRRPL